MATKKTGVKASATSKTPDAEDLIRNVLSGIAEELEKRSLFPDGVRQLELKVVVGDVEVSLAATGHPAPGALSAESMAFRLAAASEPSPSEVASRILDAGRVTFLDAHASGINDDATALKNMNDTAAGKAAKRSSYDNAPGGSVSLALSLLLGIEGLSKDYTFTVTELAGGSHSANSRHYAGIAFDVNSINGKRVDKAHPDVATFRARAGELGATEILGPGNPNHDTHVHAAWPRPKAGLLAASKDEAVFCEQ